MRCMRHLCEQKCLQQVPQAVKCQIRCPQMHLGGLILALCPFDSVLDKSLFVRLTNCYTPLNRARVYRHCSPRWTFLAAHRKTRYSTFEKVLWPWLTSCGWTNFYGEYADKKSSATSTNLPHLRITCIGPACEAGLSTDAWKWGTHHPG